MQIHELNNYIGDLDSDAYVAIDDGTDTGKLSIPSLLQPANEKIEEANARIDNIIAGGDAPSAAEIIDARRGGNGVNYDSLGDAIRGQYDALLNDIDDLPIASIRTNAFYGDYTRYEGKSWLRGAVDLYMSDDAESDICKVKVIGGASYIAESGYASASRGALRFADSSDNFIGSLLDIGTFGVAFAMPANAAFAYIPVTPGEVPVLSRAESYPYHEDFDYYINDKTVIPRIEKDISENTSIIDAMIEDSFNLADASKFTVGKYYTNTGATGTNSSYFYTDYIPVSPGEKICSSANSRWMCCFDSDKSIVPNSDNISPAGWTVPDGVYYVIITGYVTDKDVFVVSKGQLIPYTPYLEHIEYDYISLFNVGNVYGKNGIYKTADSLNANTAITFMEYPKGLGKGTSIAGTAFFTSFDSIKVGVGDSTKLWFEVDNTSIKFYSSGALINTVQHGLSITDYISFSLLVDSDCIAHFTIDTVGGSFSTEADVGYGWDGFPYFESTHANTDVKVSVTNNDFKKSVWWFGDSYSGWAEYRILGQLKALGVTDDILVDAIPGQRSYYDANTGAYNDFAKAINFGIPKYLVWSIGMNDTDANYKGWINRVAKFCELMHIEFIAVKIPSVPGIDNSNKNAYIDEQEYRFIDWNKAVGANSSGVWYSGMLSSDNVHPNTTGAEAMALRSVVDFVEVTQYR